MPCVCVRLACAPCWRCEEAATFLATAEGQALQQAWRLVDRRWRAYQQAQAALVRLSCQAFVHDADLSPGGYSDDTRCWRTLKALGLSTARISTIWSKVRDAYDAVRYDRAGGMV